MSMVLLPEKVKLYCDVVDLRKGQHGLLGLLKQLNCEESGDVLYLFINRSRDLLKGLFWDRTGYIVLSKRLEAGRFKIPIKDETMELNSEQLRYLLDGLKLFV